MFEIVLSILGALGGGALIIGGFAHWLGKLWASRLIQAEKAKLDLETEAHKVRLKKSEFLFAKEYEAASELVALIRGILPRHTAPEMDWGEACEHIALGFNSIELKLDAYLAKHGAVLSDDVVNIIVESLAIVGEGKHEIHGGSVPSSSIDAANSFYEKITDAERKILTGLRAQVRT